MAIAAAPAARGRTNNPNGRPSAKKLAERLERARLRNLLLVADASAHRAEIARLGDELVALARRIELAITAERPDVAYHVAGRLEDLGQACIRRGGSAA